MKFGIVVSDGTIKLQLFLNRYDKYIKETWCKAENVLVKLSTEVLNLLSELNK